MKIVSWNVNGFRSVERQGGFTRLIREHKPEVIMLQEVKCVADQASEITDGIVKYSRFFTGSVIKGRHGVAMYVREDYIDGPLGGLGNIAGIEPTNGVGDYLTNHPIDPVILGTGTRESRLQVVAIRPPTLGTLFLINSYSVNSRSDLSRLSARQDYDKKLDGVIKALKQNYPDAYFILGGDLNVVAEPIDYHGTLIPHQSGMTIEEREGFRHLCGSNGLVDIFRYIHPDKQEFSWWSYMNDARTRNLGWRIDYFLLSDALKDKVNNIEVLSHYMESDHAPLLLEIDI